MKLIHRLLVANRGEIAIRVMRTARKMGISVIAVFSDADEGAPFVRFADEAVRIGPPPSRESYLSIPKIIEAAKKTGADAVHPGYGFLSENAAFAEACAEAGLVFVGPTPGAIRAMGLKREAKQIARAAGVPVVPGYEGADQSDERFVIEAKRIGLPVLIKASAGGGGKGMRIVRSDAELAPGLASARREAESAFGDPTLLLERYIDRPRHVEIQILGDAHGNLIHLFERECSIQRRHQKIIEETPSTALSPELRARMGAAAVAVGKAIGYQNAGTVEFILDPDGQFYFLEVNTRLQVEHPVTEAVTGIDLVAAQLRIASGEPLELSQDKLRQTGAAIECRLYAEDPAQGFLPASGRIHDFFVPELDGLRVDSGVETGSEVGIHYDPLLAKVITWAPNRAEAIGRMIGALERLSVQGVRNNRAFLIRLLAHPEFGAGKIDTHFIERAFAGAMDDPPTGAAIRDAAIATVIRSVSDRSARRAVLQKIPIGYRNNRFDDAKVQLEVEGGQAVQIAYRAIAPGRFRLEVDGVPTEARVVRHGDREITFEEGGHLRTTRLVFAADRWFAQSRLGAVVLHEKPRFPERATEHEAGALVAPMPGKVLLLPVSVGQEVKRGAVLVVLEAMKMEHAVSAPRDGVVAEVRVQKGDQVEADAVLVVLAD
jgi:acetyl-CoA carboxylase biotin carboxylase subunit